MSLLTRLRNTLRPSRQNGDSIDEELAFHLEARTRDLIDKGLSPGEARRQAAIAFGSTARLREETRDQHVVPVLEDLFRDTRLAFRSLRRRPGLVLTAVLSLGIGIGAATTVYSVFDALLLKPIPLPRSERLVFLRERVKGQNSSGNPTRLRDLGQAPAFSAVAGFYGESRIHVVPGAPTQVDVLVGIGNLLGVLNAPIVKGRPFTRDESLGLGAPVAISTMPFWRTKLEGNCTLPCPINLSGVDVQIIGVVDAAVRYPLAGGLIAPASLSDQSGNNRRARFLQMIGRLRDGATDSEAQAQIDTISSTLARQYPLTDGGVATHVIQLAKFEADRNRESGYATLGAVLFVLLIACVNLSGLLLARAVERQRESAVRLSLGAGTGALVRLYLIEVLLLAFAGGLAGLALASFGVPWLASMLPEGLPKATEVEFDSRTAIFSIAITLACAIICGLAPAWRASRCTNIALREGATASASSLLLRRVFVAAQVVLTFVLLCGATLAGRSLLAMTRAPLGIEPRQVLAINVNFPWDSKKADLDRFERDALARLSMLPGVISASVMDRLPLEGGAQTRPVQLPARTLPADLTARPASIRTAHPAAFSTLGAPILAGRIYRDDSAGREVVVNDAFARRYFPGENPIGRLIDIEGKGSTPKPREIVGIVSEIRETPTQAEPAAQVFLPRTAEYWPIMRFVLRSSGDPAALVGAARSELLSIDPAAPLASAQPMTEALGAEFKLPATLSAMMAAFAATALLLTLIGLYGILSSIIVQRTREIGIRLALGADPVHVVARFVRSGLSLVAIGLIPGIAGAFMMSRAVSSLLYGVAPADPVTFALPATLLFLCAAVAAYIPSRRAAAIDPNITLRHE